MSNKVPKIRFKGFEEEWKECELREVSSVLMNKRIFKTQTSNKGDIPFYKIGTFGGVPDAFISKELFDEYKTKYPYPQVGDILLSASGSIGKIVEYMGEDAYFQDSNIVWLQHKTEIEKIFLKYFYSVVEWEGLEGSTIKRLYNKNILDTKIKFPKNQEQIKIGEYFKILDNLINKHQNKYNKLINIKKSMLEKMFPKEGEDTPEIRFKGFTEPWKLCDLSNEVEFFNGLTYSPNNIVKENGTLVLRSSNVKNGEIVDADNVYVDSSVVNSRNVKKGDIIMVVRNGSRALIGKHAQIKSEMNNTVIGAFMTGIRADNPEFINALFDTQAFDEEIEKNLGATINQITNSMFRQMKFMFPKPEEQIKIGEYFKNLDNLINQNAQKLEKLKNIKKSLLEKMFV